VGQTEDITDRQARYAEIGGPEDDRRMGPMLPILHGFGTETGGREWLLPIMLVAGLGTALVARWLASLRRGSPADHDEPI
jgi:hypothetical protein